MMDWQTEIFMAALVKQQVANADYGGRWKHPLSEPKATEAELAAVEQMLGYTLNAEYRCFLSCSNGWSSFYRDIHLFGTKELLDGHGQKRAKTLLHVPCIFNELSGYDFADLLPIAASEQGQDVFLLASANALLPNGVFWITGQVVESFDSFSAWFLVMVDYNRREQARLQSLIWEGTR